jgi:hypothetical protein
MKRIPLSVTSLVALTTLAAGCASAPAAAHTPSSATARDCRQLGAQISSTEQARRAALEQEKNAWKAVVPFAVAARYANGRAAVEKADRQLEKLRAEFHLKGCDHHVI